VKSSIIERIFFFFLVGGSMGVDFQFRDFFYLIFFLKKRFYFSKKKGVFVFALFNWEEQRIDEKLGNVLSSFVTWDSRLSMKLFSSLSTIPNFGKRDPVDWTKSLEILICVGKGFFFDCCIITRLVHQVNLMIIGLKLARFHIKLNASWFD